MSATGAPVASTAVSAMIRDPVTTTAWGAIIAGGGGGGAGGGGGDVWRPLVSAFDAVTTISSPAGCEAQPAISAVAAQVMANLAKRICSPPLALGDT